MMDLGYLIRRAARSYPRAGAVDDGSRKLLLSELVAIAERFARVLGHVGVPPAGRVGVLAENRTEYLETDLAIALGRRVRVALNARLSLQDFRYMARDSGMVALVHSRRFAGEAAALRDELGIETISLDPDDETSPWYRRLIDEVGSGPAEAMDGDDGAPAWISYTSGTTGKPKGVVLSHRAIREVATNLLLELGPISPGESIVLTQPLSHGAGYFVLPYLISGGGIYVMREFSPEEVAKVGRRPDVSTLKLVPAMVPPLLELRDRDWSFETIVYGASPIPRPLIDSAIARFGPSLMQVYGQSEAPATLTCLRKADHLGDHERRFSAGRPWTTVALEIRDPSGAEVEPGELGEVVVSGPHMMSGYHGMEEETEKVLSGGWLRTRDTGRIDEEGFVHLLGRSDEMINSGGFNISPREVEAALVEHPDLAEAVVVGMPDERWGTAVWAVVRARDGAALTETDVIDFARPRLGIRRPKRVVVSAEIPRTAYGKVDREKVRARLDAEA